MARPDETAALRQQVLLLQRFIAVICMRQGADGSGATTKIRVDRTETDILAEMRMAVHFHASVDGHMEAWVQSAQSAGGLNG